MALSNARPRARLGAQSNWSNSLFTGLTTAVICAILSAMTGCRFGNRVEYPENPDQVTGIYELRPQSLTFYASHTSSGQASAPTNKIPPELTQVLTNPVILYLDRPESGSARFINLAKTHSLPVNALSDGTLRFLGGTPAEVLWDDPACTTRLLIEENGSYNRFKEASAASSGAFYVDGQVRLKIQVITTIEGTCTDSLEKMKGCYQSADDCGADNANDNLALHEWTQMFFNSYLESGAMTITDIPNLQSMAYEVDYE